MQLERFDGRTPWQLLQRILSRRALLRQVGGIAATLLTSGRVRTSAKASFALAPGFQSTPTPVGPALLFAFPISNTELRLVFSEPVEAEGAQRPESYQTESGLRVLEAATAPDDPTRVTLKTEEMDGAALAVDAVHAVGVRTLAGEELAQTRSPEFIHGIASIEATRRAHADVFPYPSRLVGKIASESCGKNGGVWEGLHAFRFTFLHEEQGGPYSSIKVVTDIEQRVPNVVEEAHQVAPGQTLHLLWAGGVIEEVNGETQLVDVGFMEGFILPPLQAPPPYPIKLAQVSGDGAKSPEAKALEGVIVRVENVTVEQVAERPDDRGARPAIFSDDSEGRVDALLLSPVTVPVAAGDRFRSVRAIVHRPKLDAFELLVEYDGALDGGEAGAPAGASPQAAAVTGGPGVVVVQGIFDPTGQQLLELGPVRRYPWRSEPSPVEPNGRFAVEVTEESGAVTVVRFDALVAADAPGAAEHGFFEVVVPIGGDVASIRITDAAGTTTFAVIDGAEIEEN